ncbi:MAG TPA: AbgT family transporter [bacterium]|nr:AbgT family transporter [bacterium]HMW33138.1 AbgT family transporter [bacterium]HMZ04629.1 AbgT family transporter [bacterium]HNB09034.1 AbgT family transporter [bacterium]HNB57388.1 AbgT family transporter [bacterium]
MLKKIFSRDTLQKVLNFIERVGNLLPHPATLFGLFALTIVIVSGIFSAMDISVQHPGTGEVIRPVSLLTVEGMHRILSNLVTNFTGFVPLGTVLVAMLGIGIAEGSGLIGSVLRLLVISAPKRLLTFVIVFAGVMSNVAGEVGYVLLIPLAAVIFLAVGRHPIAGLAAAFAGVSGGYSANLLLGTVDPLLAGLTQEAARIVDPAYHVNPACNYYFLVASTFVLSAVGTWVTEKIVEPRLGVYQGEEKPEEIKPLTVEEKRGFRYAMITGLVLTAIILIGLIPENGYLRDLKTGSVLKSPFMAHIVSFIFILGAALGIAYGWGTGKFKNDSDIMKSMGKSMETLGGYMVLVFFAAQFVAYFNWTNLGLIIAVKLAGILKTSGLGSVPLIVSMVFMTSFVNLFMGSASAKWAIMAPIFVPMFMILGYAPELTQAAYRVGDSCSNVISPMMSYFALIMAFMQRYTKDAGLGSLIATMIPYTIAFLIFWTVALVIWLIFEIPLGPDARLFLQV